MLVMLLLVLLPINSYVAVLTIVQEEWALTNIEAGALFSVYLVAYALAALLLLPLTDRLGPKRILLAASVISVVSHVSFPLFAEGLVSGLILRALAGVGFVGVYVPGARMVAERFQGRGRGVAVGLFTSAQYGANSVSLALTGALLNVLEWREAYVALGIFAIGGVPLAYLILRKQPSSAAVHSTGRLDLEDLGSPPVRYLILGYSLHAFELHAVRVWLPVFLLASLASQGREGADAVATAATIAGLALAVGAAGPVMGGVISDRLGRATAAVSIFALSGACSWVIGWMTDFPWILIVTLCVVYGWSTAADSAIYLTGLTETSDPSSLGSTLAVQAFAGLMTGAAGPIFFGGVLDFAPETYKWGVAFSGLGLVAVVAIAGLFRLQEHHKNGATHHRPIG